MRRICLVSLVINLITFHVVAGNFLINNELPRFSVGCLPVTPIRTNVNDVCLNDTNPKITFTGNEGDLPYRFNYTINGGSPIVVSSLQSSFTIDAPTNIVGSYLYELLSYIDGDGISHGFNNQTVSIKVKESPGITIDGSGMSFFENSIVFNLSDMKISKLELINKSSISDSISSCVINWGDGSTEYSGSWLVKNHNYLEGGLYNLNYKLTNGNGCSNSQDYKVFLKTSSNFSVNSFIFSTYGFYSIKDPIEFRNSAKGEFNSTFWDFGDGNVSNELNPIHTYSTEGNYRVNQSVLYPYGCVANYSSEIKAEKGYEVIIPNAFTPNDDGVNDFFKPVFRGVTTLKLDVFDGFGNIIFSEEGNSLFGWDGKFNGNLFDMKNYFYKVVITTLLGEVVDYTGQFLLIR